MTSVPPLPTPQQIPPINSFSTSSIASITSTSTTSAAGTSPSNLIQHTDKLPDTPFSINSNTLLQHFDNILPADSIPSQSEYFLYVYIF